jgi:hypothetical protein
MTEDERRQQARELIQEAFRERPLQLIEGTVIDQELTEVEPQPADSEEK